MLHVKNLNISYENVKVVQDVNFKVEKGETAVFLGFSGCGKTSIFNAIVNLLNFDGTILFNNTTIINKNVNISVSTQHYDLYNFKNVYDNITLGLKLKNKPINKEKVLSLLNTFSLEDHIYKYPNCLSGGQKQLISLFRSIIKDPELFLLDEPFSALDSFTREEAGKFLLNYLKNKNTTTLLITHSIEEALFLGDTIYILGQKPSTIIHTINNTKGLNKSDPLFLQEVVKIRKLFGL